MGRPAGRKRRHSETSDKNASQMSKTNASQSSQGRGGTMF